MGEWKEEMERKKRDFLEDAEVTRRKAIKDIPRDQVVLSTKFHPAWAGVVNNAETIVKGLENSLRQLGVEYVDVFHLHAVYPRLYDYVMSDIVPVLTKEKEKGKFRHLGVTENAPQDHQHEMFQRAFDDNCFDVIMLAYHIMNQNAERFVFPRSQNQGIGTLIMFAVRSIFSTPGRLKAEVNELVGQGRLPDWIMNKDNPLDFLLHEDGASSVIDACYRFVRHQAGADVILFGTGNLDHLMENIASINKPPLPIDDLLKVRELFGHLEGVGLDYPGGSGPKTKLGDVNEEIDTSGLKCPIPVLKAKKALRSMDAGETLRVISTDPSSAARARPPESTNSSTWTLDPIPCSPADLTISAVSSDENQPGSQKTSTHFASPSSEITGNCPEISWSM